MSSVLSQQVFQDNVVEHGVGQQAFEFGILVFEGLQPCRLGHFHPPIFGLELVERRCAQPVPAAYLRCRVA